MNRHDPIIMADEAEEQSATFALRSARTREELTSVWWRDAEHFRGAARERLQEEYRQACRRLGAGAAA